MKPIRSPYFLAAVIMVNILFAALIIWWLSFMLKSFREINASLPPASSSIETLNVDGYKRLFEAGSQ